MTENDKWSAEILSDELFMETWKVCVERKDEYDIVTKILTDIVAGNKNKQLKVSYIFNTN